MSSLSPEHSSGPRSLTQLFDNALREYTIRMGIDLARQGPLARELHGSTSVDSVIRVYEKQFRFGNVRASVGKAKMTTALRTTVGATSMLSARGEDYALGCVLSPANAVLGSIGVLLEAAEKSSTNYDVTLVNLFESVNKSLERLVVHTDNTHSITVPRIKSILVEIAIQILRICALATHKIREGRLTLGSLEASLRAGQIYHAMGSLDEMINEELSVVDTLPTGTMAVRNLEAESNERQRVEIYAKCQDWLLPPDPSVNHIDTRSRHSEGTSLWLLRSYAFENWKESGSLLWISGERTFSVAFSRFASAHLPAS
ncbi:hypothetical protein BC834DRAFT_843748 [Gloeopeniophorella convolvens]|nr:hypothetical protein BC834DRAFT_843748 [Gloeopeniophorella convolvens]